MRHIVLILALVAICISGVTANGICAGLTFRCVSVGEQCNIDTSTCGDDSEECVFCSDSYCRSGVCSAAAFLGDECGSAGVTCAPLLDPVYPTHASTCVEGFCGTAGAPFLPGDDCSHTETLVQESNVHGGCAVVGSSCVDNECTAIPEGSPCDNVDSPCQQGTFCSNGVCRAWLTIGENCSATDVCIPTAVCSLTHGVCVQLFSLGLNEVCNEDLTGPVGADGLHASLLCNKNMACVAGECKNVPASLEGADCDDDEDCNGGVGFTCERSPCNSDRRCTLKATPSEDSIAQAYFDYKLCLQENFCDRESLPFRGVNASNCAQKNCFSLWEAYVNALNPRLGECPEKNAAVLPAIGFMVVLFCVLAQLL